MTEVRLTKSRFVIDGNPVTAQDHVDEHELRSQAITGTNYTQGCIISGCSPTTNITESGVKIASGIALVYGRLLRITLPQTITITATTDPEIVFLWYDSTYDNSVYSYQCIVLGITTADKYDSPSTATFTSGGIEITRDTCLPLAYVTKKTQDGVIKVDEIYDLRQLNSTWYLKNDLGYPVTHNPSYNTDNFGGVFTVENSATDVTPTNKNSAIRGIMDKTYGYALMSEGSTYISDNLTITDGFIIENDSQTALLTYDESNTKFTMSQDMVFSNDVTIGNDLTVTGNISIGTALESSAYELSTPRYIYAIISPFTTMAYNDSTVLLIKTTTPYHLLFSASSGCIAIFDFPNLSRSANTRIVEDVSVYKTTEASLTVYIEGYDYTDGSLESTTTIALTDAQSSKTQTVNLSLSNLYYYRVRVSSSDSEKLYSIVFKIKENYV